MNIAVFTSNHPRHLSLIRDLASIADTVFAVQEAKTMFQGSRPGMFEESPAISGYFGKVASAERAVFGGIDYLPENVRHISLAHGDLNLLHPDRLGSAWDADYFVVFGASYIKGEMVERLIENRAVNIHMGVSPFYRGNSCNFWPLYDGNPQYVGATIHLLSKGLDSGAVLFHALPKVEAVDSFTLGMKAVKAAHIGLVTWISENRLAAAVPQEQDDSLEIRYSRAAEFNEAIVQEYDQLQPTAAQVHESLNNRNVDDFFQPFVPA